MILFDLSQNLIPSKKIMASGTQSFYGIAGLLFPHVSWVSSHDLVSLPQ